MEPGEKGQDFGDALRTQKEVEALRLGSPDKNDLKRNSLLDPEHYTDPSHDLITCSL